MSVLNKKKLETEKNKGEKLSIPYDIYESPEEIFIVIPLGGVNKNSLNLAIQDYKLHITGKREKLNIKTNLNPIKEQCYWWEIEQSINLPNHIYFDKIHSKLTSENILHIIIPKALIPEKIKVDIE